MQIKFYPTNNLVKTNNIIKDSIISLVEANNKLVWETLNSLRQTKYYLNNKLCLGQRISSLSQYFISQSK